MDGQQPLEREFPNVDSMCLQDGMQKVSLGRDALPNPAVPEIKGAPAVLGPAWRPRAVCLSNRSAEGFRTAAPSAGFRRSLRRPNMSGRSSACASLGQQTGNGIPAGPAQRQESSVDHQRSLNEMAHRPSRQCGQLKPLTIDTMMTMTTTQIIGISHQS